MKKLLIVVAMFGLMVGVAFAALTPVAEYIHKNWGQTIYITQRLSLSADATAVDMDQDLVGGYLFSVEIVASADDAVTFSIDSGNGATIFTDTTVGAIAGEIANPTGYWPINSLPNYTLSGLGAGTVVIEITVAKR
jgi:hypothetical protein